MASDATQRIVKTLMERYDGRSLAEQAEITLQDSPNTQFQAFQLGVLTDARVHPDAAVAALTDFGARKWTTAKGFRDAPREDVRGVLHDAGYPEEDADRLVTTLTDAALHLLDDHGGDLGGLRRVAGGDPDTEREYLRRFVQMRDKGIDGFFREVQILWDEVAPFADKETLDAAGRLDLGDSPGQLRKLVDSDEDFVGLADALLRARHEDSGFAEVREAAGVNE